MPRGVAARIAAVAALLILAAIALHPAGPVPGSAGRMGTDAVAVALAAGCGALAAACAVGALSGIRTLRRLPPAARRRPNVVRSITTLSLCAALLLSPAGALLLQRFTEAGEPPRRPVAAEVRENPPAGGQSTSRVEWLPQAAAFGALIVLAGLLSVTVLRRRRVPIPAEAEQQADLQRAAAAGFAALNDEDRGADPRERVIRCYAAMERVLAATGTARRAADTPAELLARAEAGGRIPGAPAATLTELFRRARYGRAPMTAGDVDAARDCLSRLHVVASGPTADLPGWR